MILIDNFPVDLSIKEEHKRQNDISNFPMESGSSFSDHVIKKPQTCTIDGLVSDSPIGTMELLRDLEGENAGLKPSEETRAKLEELDDSKRAVTIVSSLKVYENMILESLDIPKDKDHEGGLWFTAVFKQAKIIKNQVTRVAAPALQKTRPLGPKPPAPTSGPPPVYRKVAADGTWYDPDIGGWRYSATYSKERGRYLYYKGIAVGFDELETDAVYRQRILKRDYAGLEGYKVDQKTGKPVPDGSPSQIISIDTDPAKIDQATQPTTDSLPEP